MNALSTALYSKLSAGTALTALLAGTASIYDTQAPNGASLPFIVFNVQGGGDRNSEDHRVKDLVIQVRAYTSTSMANADAIDNQIDALLHNGSISVSGWTQLWLRRETDLKFSEVQPNTNTVWSSGALYRVILEKN